MGSIECLAEEKDHSGATIEIAKLKDGSTEQLVEGEIQRLTEASARPFPAAPETFVLQKVFDDNDRLDLERVPVPGRIVTPNRGVVPITRGNELLGDGSDRAGGDALRRSRGRDGVLLYQLGLLLRRDKVVQSLLSVERTPLIRVTAMPADTNPYRGALDG